MAQYRTKTPAMADGFTIFPSSIIEPSVWSPGFIKPLAWDCPREDLSYLIRNKAIDVPGTLLRNELLQCYIRTAYLDVPTPSLRSLCTIFDPHSVGCEQVSLILFQAMMFSATAHVDVQSLKAAVFRSRTEIRAIFSQKVNVT